MTTTDDDQVILEAVRAVADGTAAGRVFGTPISQNGTIVLPVASIAGGGGGGGGRRPDVDQQMAHGSGGGFGLSARAMGAFVIKDGTVTWRPAIDTTLLILGGQLVVAAALSLVRVAIKRRRR
jgi:uncharacterized spore protein YtfJ